MDSAIIVIVGKYHDASILYTVHAEHSEDEEGNNEQEPILFCKEAHVCGTAIESQYYAPPNTPRKCGRIIATKYICCHFYTDGDLVSRQGVI